MKGLGSAFEIGMGVILVVLSIMEFFYRRRALGTTLARRRQFFSSLGSAVLGASFVCNGLSAFWPAATPMLNALTLVLAAAALGLMLWGMVRR